MSANTETRTQEDITELHATHGLGCKACEQPIAPGTATTASGDVYCWECGVNLELLVGATVTILPTREQVAGWARWEAAGIGVN